MGSALVTLQVKTHAEEKTPALKTRWEIRLKA